MTRRVPKKSVWSLKLKQKRAYDLKKAKARRIVCVPLRVVPVDDKRRKPVPHIFQWGHIKQ